MKTSQSKLSKNLNTAALIILIGGIFIYLSLLITGVMVEMKITLESGFSETSFIKFIFKLLEYLFTINHLKFNKETPIILIGLMGFTALITMPMLMRRKKKYIEGKEHGSAEWSDANALNHLTSEVLLKEALKGVKDKEEIQKIKDKYENTDLLLTSEQRVSYENREINNHVAVIGGSSAGKSLFYTISNILQGKSNIVTTDPKGELLGFTGWFLTKIAGYRLKVLNLYQLYLSDGYNPLKYIKLDRPDWESNTEDLITSIIENTDAGEHSNKSSDPFWDKAERMLLRALFFATIQGFPEKERNMRTVLKLLAKLNIDEQNDQRNSDLDIFFNLFEKKYGDHIAVRIFNELRSKATGRLAINIGMCVSARLSAFNSDSLMTLMDEDDMELENISDVKLAYFLVMPPSSTSYNFIAGMFYTQLFQEVNYQALIKNKYEGMKLKIHLQAYLDEFYNTCRIPHFLKILSYVRSLNVGLCPMLQSVDQLEDMFGKSWGSFIDNCNHFIYLGKNRHVNALQYISNLVGKATFDKKSYSRSRGAHPNWTTSEDVIGRNLIDESELSLLKPDECILLSAGHKPFFSKKINFKDHPNYKYTGLYDSKLIYEHKPPRLNKSEIESKEIIMDKISKHYELDVVDYKLNFDESSVVSYLKQNFTTLGFDDTPVDLDAAISLPTVLKEIHEQKIAERQKISEILNFKYEIDETSVKETVDQIEKEVGNYAIDRVIDVQTGELIDVTTEESFKVLKNQMEIFTEQLKNL